MYFVSTSSMQVDWRKELTGGDGVSGPLTADIRLSDEYLDGEGGGGLGLERCVSGAVH